MDNIFLFFAAGVMAGVIGTAALAYWFVRQKQVTLSDIGQELARYQARTEATARQLDVLHNEKTALEQETRVLQQQLVDLQTKLARSEEREHALNQSRAQMEAMLEDSKRLLKTEFEGLAGKIFEERSKKFQEQNQLNMDGLLRPFKQQIDAFRKRVDEVHTQDSQDRASLRERIQSLQELNKQMHADALNLTNALKGQVKTQGNWGEMILERVFEESGLKKGREYDLQVSLKDEEGRTRQPDAIVHLPEGKDVIVDAKVSLVAYERYHAADNETEKVSAINEHIQSVRAHIRGLSDKDYGHLSGVRSLDFVLLFIPVEAAFMLAMDNDPQLYQQAYEKNIVLVSPTTLLVTLRTIQNIWRYEYQNRNALDIAKRAGKICDQIVLIEEALEELGGRLSQAQKAYDQAHGRLVSGRGNLLGQAHKLQSLGARAKKALPDKVSVEDDAVEEDEEAS